MKIGIIGALDEELIPVRALSQHLEKIERGNRTYWHGDMHGHQVYLTRCDPGKVNAVIATQQLLDFFEPDVLFNMGSSGALSPDLEVGDLVVATDAIQHDFDLTGWGMKPGEILFDVVTKPETGQLGFTSRHAFITDPKLTNLAFETARSLTLDEINGHKPTVYKGRVVSGDQFISSVEKAGQLLTTHNALAVTWKPPPSPTPARLTKCLSCASAPCPTKRTTLPTSASLISSSPPPITTARSSINSFNNLENRNKLTVTS